MTNDAKAKSLEIRTVSHVQLTWGLQRACSAASRQDGHRRRPIQVECLPSKVPRLPAAAAQTLLGISRKWKLKKAVSEVNESLWIMLPAECDLKLC